jgi:hypothetical protein
MIADPIPAALQDAITQAVTWSRPDLLQRDGSRRAAVAAAALLGQHDRAQLPRVNRTPSDIHLTAGDMSGHPRSTTHPGSYGHCPLEDVLAQILAAYADARYPVEPVE